MSHDKKTIISGLVAVFVLGATMLYLLGGSNGSLFSGAAKGENQQRESSGNNQSASVAEEKTVILEKARGTEPLSYDERQRIVDIISDESEVFNFSDQERKLIFEALNRTATSQ
ncbi:MAG: hypothetical protein Q8P86_00320 [bacterium]|nr:hypothetical protein [bacterium]